MEAPEIGPPTIASSPTVPPIAIAAASPTARVSVATAMITNIRNAVRTISHTNDWVFDPAGSVAPTCASRPSDARSSAAASTAPARQLRDPVGKDPHPREMPGDRERERHGRVEVSTRDVPDPVDHHHDHEAERDRHTDVPERSRLRVDHH